MKIGFVDEKTKNSFCAMLGKISFKYCNNIDGRLFTTISDISENSNDVVRELVSKINPVLLTRTNVIVLNLLVNPYFDELCVLLKNDKTIKKGKIDFIKKYIFDYLKSENLRLAYKTIKNVEGYEIYFEKKMYEKSIEMSEILSK